jgi:SAM-dependent methyltransferase
MSSKVLSLISNDTSREHAVSAVHARYLDEAYLKPKCRPSTLDSFGNRRLLLASVKRALGNFRGTVLDVGCGDQPYKSLILAHSAATAYIGLDLVNDRCAPPDVEWDGKRIPLPNESVDSVLLTEVLEHCPDAQSVLSEANRVLRPGGFLFLTVPFIWPIHTVPYDEFRYTPYSLRRILAESGFPNARIEATGGRHAVLAVTLGLWVRRRPLTSRVHLVTKPLLSYLLWPAISLLFKMDERPKEIGESTLLVGLTASARKNNHS